MGAVLSYTELCELVKQGVVIGGELGRVNSASIDVTLGREILVEDHHAREPIIDLSARQALRMVPRKLDERGYVLGPGEFILAQTAEFFNLPDHISAEYKLKSSMARIGLEHLNAGWCDAGWHGSVLTLELKNMTRYHKICVRPGDAIGQMIFYRHLAVPRYASYAVRGAYNGHTTVVGAQPAKGVKDD